MLGAGGEVGAEAELLYLQVPPPGLPEVKSFEQGV